STTRRCRASPCVCRNCRSSTCRSTARHSSTLASPPKTSSSAAGRHGCRELVLSFWASRSILAISLFQDDGFGSAGHPHLQALSRQFFDPPMRRPCRLLQLQHVPFNVQPIRLAEQLLRF